MKRRMWRKLAIAQVAGRPSLIDFFVVMTKAKLHSSPKHPSRKAGRKRSNV